MVSVPSRVRAAVDFLAAVGMLVTSALLIWILVGYPKMIHSKYPTTSQLDSIRPSTPVSLDGMAISGSDSAQVAVIEYADFECPYCAKVAHDSIPVLVRELVQSGKVMFAFRHLPLTRLHPFAEKAAEAAECARRQGKFWGMHDLLFMNQSLLDIKAVGAFGASIGLDQPQFLSCLSGAAVEKIRADVASAAELQITGTPTFLFGTVRNRQVRVLRRVSGFIDGAELVRLAQGMAKESKSLSHQF